MIKKDVWPFPGIFGADNLTGLNINQSVGSVTKHTVGRYFRRIQLFAHHGFYGIPTDCRDFLYCIGHHISPLYIDRFHTA
jgi:hypothetical protein